MEWKPLPVGIDDFEKIVTGDYFYVDKTLFIKELLEIKGEVNLFTRPRRFGKTLNMSMLRYFFEGKSRKASRIFQGLDIMKAGEKYLDHMGKYPVIMISLKSSMKQPSYELAFEMYFEKGLKRGISAPLAVGVRQRQTYRSRSEEVSEAAGSGGNRSRLCRRPKIPFRMSVQLYRKKGCHFDRRV